MTEFQLRINYQNANGDPDAYHIDDMEIDGDDITFSWLLEENVTKYKGSIQIAFGAIKPGDESEDPDKNRWNTTINTECTCLVGLKSTQMVVESNPDSLAQIWTAIDEMKSSVGITEETDPTIPSWAKEPTKPTYTAKEVGADAAGTAVSKVTEHNTAVGAHADIRLLVQGLTDRLNALADSDDETLDQMSEIVTYIKNNKSLIDGITTSKVSVSDIVNNVVTNVSNRPLSAAQGVVLKGLIDAITVPEELPNPETLTIRTESVDGSSNQIIYDGRQSKSIVISPDTLGLSPSEGGGSSGEITLIQETGLTTWAQNATFTVDNISEHDMVGIEVYPNYGTQASEYSSIQWFRVEASGTRNYALYAMDVNDSNEGEGNVRRISINFDTGVITSVSGGYYYNWSSRGSNAQSCVPSRIYGMKF